MAMAGGSSAVGSGWDAGWDMGFLFRMGDVFPLELVVRI